MNAAVYEKLVQVAREKRTINYTDLAQVADLSLTAEADMKSLGFMLDEIAEHELAAGRPLLPVVVVRENNNMPGAGLFKYARRKGLQAKKTDDLTFFAEELGKVHRFWTSGFGESPR